jgi:exopolyphosphatase/guanosine-5'-triphosphate,3'-diphosphate pyrophosphatase
MEIYETLTPLPLNKRRMIRGLSKERADIFIASLSEITILAKYCNISEIIFSSKGLREGLIEEYMVQYCISK